MVRFLILILVALAGPALAESEVTARNDGYVTRCAEMDNVVVSLIGPGVREFELRATHPAYLAGREGDSLKADFTDCVFPDEVIYDHEPFSTVLYQDARFKLVGHRLSKDWRPDLVDVAVGDQVVHGLHLTQLLTMHDGRFIEIVVLYPGDGYWRFKPLSPVGRADVGYGSSVVLGPIEVASRPMVRIRRVTFDPATLEYRLDFVAGGSATVRLVSVGRDALRAQVTFDRPTGDGPFAVLSSMHVSPENSDVARMSVRPVGDALWRMIPIDTLTTARGAEFAFGRDLPSRHNYSAPDTIFGPFR